jgi:hypothetical protein
MRVSWATACQATAAVSFGTSPGSLTTVTGPAPSQYKAPSYTSPYLYHVTLSGLTPGTQYYYQVGDATSGKSALQSFKAHPGVGADIPTTVAVIGDPGQTDNSASTYAHVSASKADYVTIVGDLSYADSVETRWDSWGDMISNMSAVLPTMTTVGVRAAQRLQAQRALLLAQRPSPHTLHCLLPSAPFTPPRAEPRAGEDWRLHGIRRAPGHARARQGRGPHVVLCRCWLCYLAGNLQLP